MASPFSRPDLAETAAEPTVLLCKLKDTDVIFQFTTPEERVYAVRELFGLAEDNEEFWNLADGETGPEAPKTCLECHHCAGKKNWEMANYKRSLESWQARRDRYVAATAGDTEAMWALVWGLRDTADFDITVYELRGPETASV